MDYREIRYDVDDGVATRRPAALTLEPRTDMPEVDPWWRLRAFDS